MKKLVNIQALRGVAVLLVVLFHLTTIEQKYGGAQTILPHFLQFGMFGVDLFFVISGFVMVIITRGKFQNFKNAIVFLWHRITRIYPTYWFYSLIVLIIFLVQPNMVNSSQGNEVNILASFLLLPSDKLPLVMVGWTLIHEMYFYLVFFFILLFVPEKLLASVLIIWSFLVAGANLLFNFNSPYTGLVFNPLTLEFILGCFIAIYYFYNTKTLNTYLLLLLAIGSFIFAILGHHLFTDFFSTAHIQGWWRVFIFGMPAFIIVLSFTFSERNGFVLHSLLTKIGDASYSIYLSHILTLSAIGRLWKTFSGDALWDNYIMVPLLLLSAIAVGMFSYKYIEKPLMNYSRIPWR